jgi:hypothetical protein
MGEFEDVLDRLKEEGLDDEVHILEGYSKNRLREQAAKAGAAEKRASELEAELAILKAAPKREAALRAAGVDLAALADNPAALEALERSAPEQGKEYDADWAARMVERYKLPVGADGGTPGTPAPTAKDFGQPGGPTGTAKPAAKTSITPEEANSWDAAKRLRFIEMLDREGKMDLYELLLRGETITGIAFT